MKCASRLPLLFACLVALAPGRPLAGEPQASHLRGDISKVEVGQITIRTQDGRRMHLALTDRLTVVSLSRASFADLDFGSYVGAVALRVDADGRHKGLELRIVDEPLRGIGLGVRKWGSAPNAVIAHGWVEDIDERVVSIKYGPTDQEEMAVEVAGDVPILKMSVGDRSLIRPGAHVHADVHQEADGRQRVVLILVGKDKAVPPLYSTSKQK